MAPSSRGEQSSNEAYPLSPVNCHWMFSPRLKRCHNQKLFPSGSFPLSSILFMRRMGKVLQKLAWAFGQSEKKILVPNSLLGQKPIV